MKRNRRKNKGFTLVEVVISAAILAILIVPIASLTITTIKTSDSAEDKQKATQIGQQLLDEFKSFDDIALTHGVAPGNDTFTLLNGKVLEVNRDASNNIVQIDPVGPTNNFVVTDEQGVEYTVRFELTRDTNATYTPSAGTTVTQSNYNQYIEFDDNTVDIFNIPSNASVGQHIVLSPNIDLNIDNNMGIQMVDSSNLYPTTVQTCNGVVTTEGKILIYIKSTMQSRDINLNVSSEYTRNITIDVIKEKRDSRAVNVNVNTNQCAGNIIVNRNLSQQGVNSIGDLYTAKVIVTRAGSDTLFEGESKKNILFH
jgi:prepilin-type N-terminal cleavage/methylation domain-containing protein